MLLAGDIGGTKTVLALISEEKGARQPVHEARYPSDDYASLEAIIEEFISVTKATVTRASFGVAGPVVDGRAQITNLPWMVDTAVIRDQFNIPAVRLLNDLEAIATAVPHLEASDLITLNEGVRKPKGGIGIVAPGTGLGQAFLVWNGRSYEAFPSEGGHIAFGPTNEQQTGLLKYMLQRYRHVSYERICSGVGLPNIYNYFRDEGHYHEPQWLRSEIEAAEDPTPVIVNAALEQKTDICVATLDMFMEVLGSQAGNMALTVLATGGIYIGGGIPPRILPQLKASKFLESFRNKGRFSQMMSNVPIYVITNPQAGLYGAIYAGMEVMAHG
ncbi:MAG: glucokinase [Ardenticatenaceae bacterium]|nr:glucokinase [Ardenticatenaceae bacterium]